MTARPLSDPPRTAELLSPAGDMSCLDAALRFGADAVYAGGPQLQLRAASAGFDLDGLREAAQRAHALGRRLYVAVNAFPSGRELDALADYAQALYELGADAAIVADLGAISVMRRAQPKLDIHVSTQANCQNWAAARAYHDMGATRVVLARELSLEDIAELRAKTPASLELEAFVHGAMCMAYSGRCLISAYLTGRSANRGACAQSCRWRYHLVEEKRPGEYFPIEEDAEGTTLLSSFDLCAMDFVEQILAAGVSALKIEGRMKTPYYVATVTGAYRRRLDALARGETTPALLEALRRELDAVSHRAYASGFYFGQMKRHAPEDGVYRQDCAFVATVTRRLPGGRGVIQLRNRFDEGAALEVVSPHSLGLSFPTRHIQAVTDVGAGPAPAPEAPAAPRGDIDANGQAAAPSPWLAAATVPMALYALDLPEAVAPGDLLRVRLTE